MNRKVRPHARRSRHALAALALVAALSIANAGDILRGGASGVSSRRNPADGSTSAGSDAAAQTRANAKDRLARTTTALESVRKMQEAARAAAEANGGKNLGRNPNTHKLPVFNGLNGAFSGGRLSNVRNGLGKGGLQVAGKVPKDLRHPEDGEDPSLWTGADLPTEKKSKGGTTVTIRQTESQALLTWKTFNIGRKTTLEFDQSAGGDSVSQWIAFNRVLDRSGEPSQILGSIKAPGQVYVINQNGIIFGGTSQVNVHTLVASSLPINDGLINNGLLNNPDAQFLFSALPIGAGTKGTPAFNPRKPFTDDRRNGDVQVLAGAMIESPQSPEGIGGRVALIGANVENAGTISTEGGQTILAAGLQVGFEAHSTTDATLRGLDVFVGAVQRPDDSGPVAGVATNSGLIEGGRSNVTITGRTVNQLGVIDSSTSVSFNGRIDLLANYDAVSNIAYDSSNPTNGRPFLFQKTGIVRMGEDSVTRILPEYDSDETVVGTELSLRSQMNFTGQAVRFDRGAMVLAPNAEIAIDAGTWKYLPSTRLPQALFQSFGGVVRVAPESFIDVAGTTDVFVPLSQSILDVELRGAELADSPLQRDGILRGQTVTIDSRRTGVYNGKFYVGTPLADASGYVGLIQRNVAQLTVDGGSVTVTAGDSVVLENGSIIDASGGWMQHEGGIVRTTRLVYGGQLVDIADATPDRIYNGVYSDTSTQVSEKYGIVKTFRRPLSYNGGYYDSDYIEGANGGEISITAPAMALDGSLAGRTVIGPRQLRDAQNATVPPTTGSLELTFKSQDPTDYLQIQLPDISPTSPTVVFRDNAKQSAPNSLVLNADGEPVELTHQGTPFILDPDENPFVETDERSRISLNESRRERVYLSPDLLSDDNFGSLTVDNRDGDVVVPHGIEINAPAGGSLIVKAANIGIYGDITAPSGTLDFTTYNFSPYEAEIRLSDNTADDFFLPEVNPDRGYFTLGRGATLSTAGLTVDDRFESASRRSVPILLDGGTVHIEAFDAQLLKGSVVDVSGGVMADRDAEISYGDAGSIAVLAGRDPRLNGLVGGGLRIDGEFLGYSGAKGGSLALQSQQVIVGEGVGSRLPGMLTLTPDFFNKGGFGNFDIAGIGTNATFEIGSFGSYSLDDFVRANDPNKPEVYHAAVVIERDTHIAPIAQSLQAFAVKDEPIRVQRQIDAKADRTPVSLAFNGLGAVDDFTQLLAVRGDVRMESGASIVTDPGASVSLKGDTVLVRGAITAPGGSIEITGADHFPSLEQSPATALTTVFLSSTARLSTAGTFVRTFDIFGNRTGYVVSGGSISLSGNIQAAHGSILDVSGSNAVVDVSPALLGLNALLQTGKLDGPVVPVTSGLNEPLVSLLTVPVRLDSDAGSITLAGGEFLYSDATLVGRAGGPTALGGSLEVSSGRFYPSNVQFHLPTDITLVVTQSDPGVAPFRNDATFSPLTFLSSDESARRIGNPVRDGNGNLLEGVGHFTADRFLEGGFDSLDLQGVVSFSGPVSIDAGRQISVADGGVLYADDDVRLSAPYVKLGTQFAAPLAPEDPLLTSIFTLQGLPYYFAPTKGQGRLEVVASLIDIGNLSLQNIRRANFIAEGGDIRGDGTLNIAGRLKFRAAQIYPPTGTKFTIVAYDFPGKKDETLAFDGPLAGSAPKLDVTKLGSVTFEASGTLRLPLSAGGELAVYGSIIDQGGTLLAPFGSITLGWDGSGAAPTDVLAGNALPFPTTHRLSLLNGSLTSVAGVDPTTGEQLFVPFGLNSNETAWIDPRGIDITAGGLPAKSISLEAGKLATQRGSQIDIRGGGDLLAYRWVEGLGGSIDLLGQASEEWSAGNDYERGDLVTYNGRTYSARQDTPIVPKAVSVAIGSIEQEFERPTPGANLYWTEVKESFAVIPDYDANFAPYSTFTASDRIDPLASDPGYTSSGLSVGDRIFLRGGSALPAGEYTLLPSRYALVPGAVLVTQQSGDALDAITFPDGSTVVSGVRYNHLNPDREMPATFSRFEVTTPDVYLSRAEYQVYSANNFLTQRAGELGLENVQRLPIDSGNLSFHGIEGLKLRGIVQSRPPSDGRGAAIDISTPLNILITAPGATIDDASVPPDFFGVGTFGDPLSSYAVLNAETLNSWGADSLLIGGLRQDVPNGSRVNVETGSIVVQNEGSPLMGPEIILAADRYIGVAKGSSILQSGVLTEDADRLLFSGDGVALRVSSDFFADSIRRGTTDSSIPQMSIERAATIAGTSVTLDSTYGTSLAHRANIHGEAITLNSGQITIGLRRPGDIVPTDGLLLEGPVLRGFQGAEFLSLLSYSSIDIYGVGEFRAAGRLELHAGDIRGFNTGDGRVTVSANEILLDNKAGVTGPGALTEDLTGTLAFRADRVELGDNALNILHFGSTRMTAPSGLRISGDGSLNISGSLLVNTPIVTTARSASREIVAGGDVNFRVPKTDTNPRTASSIGGSLAIEGRQVTINSDILLPSGLLTLHATDGDVRVNGTLDVAGRAVDLLDVTRYTNAGRVELDADGGSVLLGRASLVDVSADPHGADAGLLSISAPDGNFELAGELRGSGGSGGKDGSFILDAGRLSKLGKIDEMLNEASFNELRSYRIRFSDVLVDGEAAAHHYFVSADDGSIRVNGSIDASGFTGGEIGLSASGSVVLAPGAELSVAGKKFDASGKGGVVYLAAGSQIDGTVDDTAFVRIENGSSIDLSVDAHGKGSERHGQFEGTLHLRAPQLADQSDLQIDPIRGSIIGASNISIEGYRLYDLTSLGADGATMTSALLAQIKTDGEAFAGVAGQPVTANYSAMLDRLSGGDADLASSFIIMPGAEIIHRTGDLRLGSSSSSASSDWNFASLRFGPRSAAGVLTLRAAGDIELFNAISDGFQTTDYRSNLLAYNPLLPANAQSWSYHFTAGADTGAADYSQVLPLADLLRGTGQSVEVGSLKLGKFGEARLTGSPSTFFRNGRTSTVVPGLFQVIRTGSGDIDISAGRDILLRNVIASIYTVGTQLEDATMNGNFDIPFLNGASQGQNTLGGVQQSPASIAQYTMAGGSISLDAGRDIAHVTRMANGTIVADATEEMPIHWLYRRGYVDPETGEFGGSRWNGVQGRSDVASTTWWIDFTNFFEGVGALGGGNVRMIAGRDVSNVDAVIPTNARAPKGVPYADAIVELGGGDLTVHAGNNIDGGVYYVERGRGTLVADNTITTNATRSPNNALDVFHVSAMPQETWLPTTLFLGKGGFEVRARGDVLLGPVVNPFLLPGGYNNTFWYKTYFSTYAADSFVNVRSLGGAVTLRESTVLPQAGLATPTPILAAWFKNVLLQNSNTVPVANARPWLRLNESNVSAFSGVFSLMAPTLKVISFSNDINLVGGVKLAPSPTGTLELIARGSINGIQQQGTTTVDGAVVNSFGSSRIIVSDADPALIPGVASPFAYQSLSDVGTTPAAQSSGLDHLLFIDSLFDESGSPSQGVGQKRALHASGILHRDDASPVRLYAQNGSISGFSLFSPKFARILAGEDITDISFYIQNAREDDISVVAAGRDIIPYNENAPLRSLAQEPGNFLNALEEPLAGDLQITGQGTLEVLAGRDIDLGTGGNNADGTGVGITSIGNSRNPNLPFGGADLVVAAGIGPATSLVNSALDFDAFIDGLATVSEVSADEDGFDFEGLDPEARNLLALTAFYRALRDAGRDFNDPASPNYRNQAAYEAGFAAIETLFGGIAADGDIKTRARDIRTRNGGDISLLAPGGELVLASTTLGSTLAPPGVITEAGGNVSIFTDGDVNVGIGRIFTLRGGNQIIWSSTGDIAAGQSSKTVQSAPPTRVLLDPTSADVATDLAGLATGGGIGVLASVEGVEPGEVDLIAPVGVVDAGDAGIRATGSLNIAATAVLNASNISAASTSLPPSSAPVVSAPSVGALTSAAATAGAATSTAENVANQQTQAAPREEEPSIFSVVVLGYGGEDSSTSSDDEDDTNQSDEN